MTRGTYLRVIRRSRVYAWYQPLGSQSLNRLVLCNLLAMTLCTCQSPHDQRVDGGSNDATVTHTDVNPQMPSSPEVSEDDEHRASGSLIHPFDWRVTPHDVDPFDELISSGEERDVQCEGDAHGVEEVSPGVWSYSVETERCHWITLQQPTRRAAGRGRVAMLQSLSCTATGSHAPSTPCRRCGN